jgi:hypothetical protein
MTAPRNRWPAGISRGRPREYPTIRDQSCPSVTQAGSSCVESRRRGLPLADVGAASAHAGWCGQLSRPSDWLALGDPLFDTTSSQGRLLSTPLAAIADFERDLIRERTGESASAPWPLASSSAASAICPTTNAQRRSSAGTPARHWR